MKVYIYITAIVLIAFSCKKDEPCSCDETRAYMLALGDFPYDNTLEAIKNTSSIVISDGDLAMMHFDGGVPWQAALDSTDYPAGFLSGINGKIQRLPENYPVYLAVTPLAFARDGLALNWGDNSNESQVSPWDTLALDDPLVVKAYLSYCRYMIRQFNPVYFAYAIEANLLIDKSPVKWESFVNLSRQVYQSVKHEFPDLPVFFTIQAEAFHQSVILHSEMLADILDYTDMIAVSTYPFVLYDNAAAIPADYYPDISALASSKPFVISETSWPAENITAPSLFLFESDESMQKDYLQRLFEDLDKLNTRFVSWFFPVDYDGIWENVLKDSPDAAVVRLWKDCGLYDGTLKQRPASVLWLEAKAKILTGQE
jgi:hypothetical protein